MKPTKKIYEGLLGDGINTSALAHIQVGIFFWILVNMILLLACNMLDSGVLGFFSFSWQVVFFLCLDNLSQHTIGCNDLIL